MNKFTTSRGIEVEFRPISKETMLRFNAANPQPPVPTYEIKSVVTGTTEHVALDERSLSEKPEQFTPEQHAAWNEYAVKNGEFIQRFIKFFCIRGIEINATMDDWIEEQAFLNIPVSDNKVERKFEWITNAVLETEDDYKSVIIGVMEASGVNGDLLAQVAESFRGDIQRDADKPTGNAVEQVASGSELGGSTGDVAPTVDTQPVGSTKRTRPRVGARHAANVGRYGGS